MDQAGSLDLPFRRLFGVVLAGLAGRINAVMEDRKTAGCAVRTRRGHIPQEAFIGITYAVASAAAILAMSKATGETEHLKDMLVGNILAVSMTEVWHTALLYGAIGIFHFIFRQKFLAPSEGRIFPVEVSYLPGEDDRHVSVLDAGGVARALEQTSGDVLAFLPGVGEIKRAHDELDALAKKRGIALLDLYGDLPADEQVRVLRRSDRRFVKTGSSRRATTFPCSSRIQGSPDTSPSWRARSSSARRCSRT